MWSIPEPAARLIRKIPPSRTAAGASAWAKIARPPTIPRTSSNAYIMRRLTFGDLSRCPFLGESVERRRRRARGAGEPVSTGPPAAIDRLSTAYSDPAGMRSITAALVVVAAAVGLAAGAQVTLGRDTPGALETAAVAAATLLEPDATIPLGVIPSAFVATPNAVWATAGIEGVIRVDPHSGRIRARIDTGGAVIAALADERVWAMLAATGCSRSIAARTA